MKKTRLVALLCSFALLFSFLYTAISAAESAPDTVEEATAVFDGIVAYQQEKSGAATTADWINGALATGAGVSSEWYIITLSQSGTPLDFSAYETALLAYLSANEVPSATSRQKYALALAAVGSRNGYILKTLEDSVGKQGVMSYIFGLHLLNNGYKSRVDTKENVINTLLSLRRDDGGWAVMGTFSDVDVTAMALTALAPNREMPAVAAAIQEALTLLSARQQADGGFMSMGAANPESAAQVLLALSSLGIDAAADARFLKEGRSVFDAIRGFILSDGSVAHQKGGGSNETATVQVCYAMMAFLRFASHQTPLFLLDLANPDEAEVPPLLPVEEEDTPPHEDTLSPNGESGKKPSFPSPKTPYFTVGRVVALSVVLSLAALAALLLFFRKRLHKQQIIALILATALALSAVFLLRIQSPDAFYNGALPQKEHPVGTVTFSIRCEAVKGENLPHIPADGAILAPISVEIEEGETVYQILTQVARAYHLKVDSRGGESLAYVAGIENLYEFDFGDLSGWMYRVNGATPSVGCGEYTLKDGDTVEWLYTKNMGEDLSQ